ncbi:hypothetical protein WG66_006161 [Moniliophthora roreri]|nr:hypothetical protein WG66_006161 [Moniliophthora roreri]
MKTGLRLHDRKSLLNLHPKPAKDMIATSLPLSSSDLATPSSSWRTLRGRLEIDWSHPKEDSPYRPYLAQRVPSVAHLQARKERHD